MTALLSFSIFIFSFCAFAKPASAPDRSFRNLVITRAEAIIKGDAPAVAPRLQEIAQNRVFVGYPGGIGLQPWVFFDNYEALHRDFGVPRHQLWHRDMGRGLFAAHSGEPYQGVALNKYPWGEMIKHVSKTNLAKEAEGLRSLYEMQGKKPLILFCHSGQCPNVLNVAYYLRNEVGDGKMIDRVIIMQNPVTIGNAVANNLANADRQKRATLLSRGLTAAEINSRREEFFSEKPLEGFFYIGDHGRNKGPSARYGNFLGDLAFGHTEAVVSFDQKRPANLGQKTEYRSAFMQVLLETMYPDEVLLF